LLALLCVVVLIAPSSAKAACSSPAVSQTSDPVLRFKTTSGAGNLFASNFTTFQEGDLAYDDTQNALVLCNGTSWSTVGSSAAAGSSGYVQFNTSGAFDADSNFYWDNTNKRLGIGTASPSQLLDVAQSSSATYASSSASAGYPYTSSDPVIRVRNSNSTLGSAAYIGFSSISGGSTNAFTYIASFAENSGSSSGAIAFGSRTGGTAYSEYMRIDSSGNVGIGTASPAGILHLWSTAPQLYLTDSDTGADSRIDASSSIGSLYIDADWNNEVAGTLLGLGTDGSRYLYLNNGKVGIGTSAPTTLLYLLQSADTVNDGVLVMSTTGSNVRLWHDGTVGRISGNSTETGNIALDGGGSGNVSIGTTLPDRKFHVESDSAATSTVTYLERLTSTSTGTPAAGIGVGLEFEVETAASNNEVGATIEAVTTDVTSTSEDFDLVFKTMRAGAAASEQFRIRSTGKIKVGGGSTPTIGTCGTTPSITGNDTRGVVTFGTGSPTACTITFSAAFGSAPYCTITAYGGDSAKRYWITSTSTTTLVIGIEATATASQKFHYICIE
jgi:hypothetical protein